MVEFSLTKPEKPIPVGTVRVYFTCKCEDQLIITFRFEKDSLIHSVDKTIRHKEIEVSTFICRNGSTICSKRNCLSGKAYSIWEHPMKKQESRMRDLINYFKSQKLCRKNSMSGLTLICSQISKDPFKLWKNHRKIPRKYTATLDSTSGKSTQRILVW